MAINSPPDGAGWLAGCAIFFEFNHYKPDAKKVPNDGTFSVLRDDFGFQVSCKCYAFMDFDEIKEGHVVLEL